MKIDKFIRLCIQRDIQIAHRNRNGWVLWEWRMFAKLTSFVDYGCNFKGGKCKNNGNGGIRSSGMGCCNGCANSVGYLRTIPTNWEYLIKMARLFNKKTGFWRKGKGCVLPNELRSPICLSYMCDDYNFYGGRRNRKKAELSRPAKRLLKLLDGGPPKNTAHTYRNLELVLQNDKKGDQE